MAFKQKFDAATDCPTVPVLWSEGDQDPDWGGTLPGVDLSAGGTWIVRMRMVRPSGVLVKDATIVDAANGVFLFAWDATDLEAGPGQVVIVYLINPSGERQTLTRFKIDVIEVPS